MGKPAPNTDNSKKLDTLKLQSLKLKIDEYKVIHSRLPESLAELKKEINFEEDILLNPWGCKYQFSHNKTESEFTITSLGGDCKVGGKGFNEDFSLNTEG